MTSKELEGWIAGITDGEGSFSVVIQLSDGKPQGTGVYPYFQISLKNNARCLKDIKGYLKCGKIKETSSNYYYYRIQNEQQLINSIIPFFEEHTLKIKKQEFKIWCKIVKKVHNKSTLLLSEQREVIDYVEALYQERNPRRERTALKKWKNYVQKKSNLLHQTKLSTKSKE